MAGIIPTLAGLANTNKTFKTVINLSAPVLLAKSGAAVSHTGDTLEFALATISIPANALAANGIMRVTSFWSMTSSANVKTIRHRLGGIGGTAIFSSAPTTVGGARVESTTLALNATNSQTTMSIFPRGTDLLDTENAAISSSADMTAAQSLVITGQLALNTETITLLGYMVDYLS